MAAELQLELELASFLVPSTAISDSGTVEMVDRIGRRSEMRLEIADAAESLAEA